MAPLTAALLERDTASGEAWLTFQHMPPDEVRSALKASGWRYHGGLRAWRHETYPPPIPSIVIVATGGTTQLSTVRPRNGPEILDDLRRAKASLARANQQNRTLH